MTAIRQSFSVGGLSEGTGLFEKAIYENKIIHGNNSVLNWMPRLTPVALRTESNSKAGVLIVSVARKLELMDVIIIYLSPKAGRAKPDRRKNSKRIDGVVSSIMALHSCVRNSNDSGSVYDNEGLLVL